MTTPKICLPLLLLAAMINSSTAQEYECRLSSPIPLADGVTLEQVKNPDLGTYTMRVSYKGGQAWVGIGVNTEGDKKMAPGTAVIGRTEADGSSSVLKYALQNDDKDASGVLPVANQNLFKASFVQTETESTLTFTQFLTDDGVAITDESSWIFAVGLPDNQWEGKHKIHGSFFMPLTEDCDKITQKPTANPTESPTTLQPTTEPTMESTGIVASGVVEPVRLQEVDESNTPAPTEKDVDVQMAQEAELEDAAFDLQLLEDQLEQSSANSTIVLGPTSTHDDNLLSPTTVTVSTTTTTESSPAFSGFVMRKDETKATHPLWVAHGWTLAVAWGILAPLAVGAALLKHTLGPHANWYSLHFNLNLLVVALTIVGFALGVAATRQEDKPHFQKQNGTLHNPAGLAVFVLVLFQSVMGYTRPDAPQPQTHNDGEEDDDFTELGFSANHPPKSAHEKRLSLQEKVLSRVGISCNNFNPSAPPPTSSMDSSKKRSSVQERVLSRVGVSTNNFNPASSPARTARTATSSRRSSLGEQAVQEVLSTAKSFLTRKAWEMLHRLTGAVVVGLAWYNCHSGYQLMEETYDENDNHTRAFWGFTGSIAGVVFLLAYVGRMR